MIFEFDWNRGLFVARSRGPKKRSGGGRQSREIGIRRIAKILGTLRSEDGDGSENVTEKVNSRSFNLYRDYSKSLGEPS